MRTTQFHIRETTRVSANSELKATGLTVLLNIINVRGRLLAIYCTDPDNLTQNERIRISIDGDVLLDDTAYDIPNTDDFIHLLASLAKGSVLSGTATGADLGIMLDDRTGLPFNNRLEISYLRAVAGTTGLTINIVYAIEYDIANV